MRNFAHFCLCLSSPQTPITQVCVSFPVSCSPCLSGEAIGQGRQDQRGKESKAGRPPSVRGTEGQEGVRRRESQGRMPQCGRCYLSSCRRALPGSKGARRVTPALSVPPKEHSSDSAALWPHFLLHPGCSA